MNKRAQAWNRISSSVAHKIYHALASVQKEAGLLPCLLSEAREFVESSVALRKKCSVIRFNYQVEIYARHTMIDNVPTDGALHIRNNASPDCSRLEKDSLLT